MRHLSLPKTIDNTRIVCVARIPMLEHSVQRSCMLDKLDCHHEWACQVRELSSQGYRSIFPVCIMYGLISGHGFMASLGHQFTEGVYSIRIS